MQIRKRVAAWTAAGAYGVWTVFLQPVWNLNVEKYAQQQKMDGALSNWSAAVKSFWLVMSYIPSSFGLGFVLGALIFAYWDSISHLFRKHVLRQEVEEAGIRAWLGRMVPFFDDEEDSITLMLWVINVGDVPFRFGSVDGTIKFTYGAGSGARQFVNLSPLLKEDCTKEAAMDRGYYGQVILHVPIPKALRKELPDTYGWTPYPSFQFDNLNVMLVAEDGSQTKRLELWDSMRLSSGETRIRYDETMRIFKSDAERDDVVNGLKNAAKLIDRLKRN